ncbi:hypothetical protein NC652_009597 [Populus alba x Populus x berolinensis]|nr:hypothetical protein NC652_009597 [Populus alba x Populus x berolinensis]
MFSCSLLATEHRSKLCVQESHHHNSNIPPSITLPMSSSSSPLSFSFSFSFSFSLMKQIFIISNKNILVAFL